MFRPKARSIIKATPADGPDDGRNGDDDGHGEGEDVDHQVLVPGQIVHRRPEVLQARMPDGVLYPPGSAIQRPVDLGVNVIITIFTDFYRFSAINW
jgi:hypothetical protein